MANQNKAHNRNIPGNFFVDTTCIDCGTCYWVAPQTFQRDGEMSKVYHQPEPDDEAAYRALFSCPVGAIGAKQKSPTFKVVAKAFPHNLTENIYLCGFHSEKSFGATSYFVQDPRGNFLVDSPRFTQVLFQAFDQLGGIDQHLLSHRDDIADTDKYWAKFDGERYIHNLDTNSVTDKYEHIFEGDKPIEIRDELLMIPVPGHTKGSVCYLYKNKYLFTGDHLAFSPPLGHLYAFKTACWYNFDVQIKSMESLLDYEFEYVLPGHGSPVQLPKSEMRESLKKCIAWMKK